jgi:O-antigen/teichoic acid export membrane protein
MLLKKRLILIKIKSYVTSLLKSDLILPSSVVIFGIVIAGIGGLLFQLLAAKYLSFENFSSLSATLAVYNIVVAVMLGVNVILSRNSAIYGSNKEYFNIKALFNFIFVVYTLLMVVALPFVYFFSDFISQIINVENKIYIVFLYFLVWITFLLGVNTSIINGLKKFYLLSILNSSVYILRLIFCGSALYLGWHLNYILTLYIITMLTMFVISYIYIKPIIKTTKKATQDIRKLFGTKFILPPLLGNVAIILLFQIDILLANKFFDSILASNYIAGAIIGKVIVYLPVGITTVLFPSIVSNYNNNISSQKIIREAHHFLIIITFAIAIFFYFFGEYLVTLFYNDKYEFAGNILKYYGLAVAPLTFIYFYEHILLAKNKILFSFLVLIITPMMIIYFWYYSIPSLDNLLLSIFYFGSLILILGYFFKFFKEVFK